MLNDGNYSGFRHQRLYVVIRLGHFAFSLFRQASECLVITLVTEVDDLADGRELG